MFWDTLYIEGQQPVALELRDILQVRLYVRDFNSLYDFVKLWFFVFFAYYFLHIIS